jgi:hypothetical protein
MFGKDVNSLKIYHRDAVGGKLSEIKTILGDILYKAFSLTSFYLLVCTALTRSLVPKPVMTIELQVNWNDKFAAIFQAGYECFLQLASVLFYKMDAKNTA